MNSIQHMRETSNLEMRVEGQRVLIAQLADGVLIVNQAQLDKLAPHQHKRAMILIDLARTEKDQENERN